MYPTYQLWVHLHVTLGLILGVDKQIMLHLGTSTLWLNCVFDEEEESATSLDYILGMEQLANEGSGN